jgi:hypothetical protein
MAFATLPSLHLVWTQYVPSGGDTFVQYNVKRRLTAVGGAYSRIAVIPTVATVTYDDYGVAPATSYDYVISATVTRSGVQIEGPNSAPVTRSCTFRGLFLHDVVTPTQYLEWRGEAVKADRYQAQAFMTGWNQQNPSLFVGEAESGHYQLTTAKQVPLSNTEEWNALIALLTRQRLNSSVFMYRNGMTGDTEYVAISGEQRRAGTTGTGGVTPVQRQDTLTANVSTVDLIAIKYSPVV